MSDNPILLDSDEDGLSVTILLDLLDDCRFTGPADAPETVRGRISRSAAWDLYEHVQRELGAWYAEGIAARSAVAAGVTLAEYVGAGDPDDGLDPLDPKSSGYADRLRDLGDINRKAEREGGKDGC